MTYKVVVVEEKENASTDFYLKSFFKHLNLDCLYLTASDLENNSQNIGKVDFVFIVRYLSNTIIKWIASIKPKKVFYLMDDDILDIRSMSGLPYNYVWKIFYKAYRYKSWIKDNATVLFPHENLKRKYSNYRGYVLPPNPGWIDKPVFNASLDKFVVFYHATASHSKEYFWLSNLIKKAGKREFFFEVVTGKNFDKLFKGLDNTWTVRQMGWQTYKKFLKLQYRTLSLAINLPTSFNLMRSYTKFFNNIYAGVSGLYCENFPIAKLIKQYDAGFVLKLDYDEWLEVLDYVYCNPGILKQQFDNSVRLFHYLREYAIEHYDIIYRDM